jgi:hypothetical protein
MKVGVKGRATLISLAVATGKKVGWISGPFWK